jgi:hypothetical protein
MDAFLPASPSRSTSVMLCVSGEIIKANIADLRQRNPPSEVYEPQYIEHSWRNSSFGHKQGMAVQR